MHAEAAGGILLVVAAVIALVWANSPWSGAYQDFWHSKISLSAAGHHISLDLRHWVNDGLMTTFFLIVGLEIKRELTTGHLSNRRSAALPIAAAIGGMAVPALLYLAIAGGTDARGWGVPMATDIALAVGVLALLGTRVSASLRAYLLGLAIVDDIGAIIIIAAVYSTGISWSWLLVAVIGLLLTVVARLGGIHTMIVYVALGATVWLAMHEGGIHPTLAGVAMGLLAPTVPRIDPELIDIEELGNVSTVEHARTTTALARSSVSVVEWLQHLLHPYTSYLIVPVFALANSGIEISLQSLKDASTSPIAWGIFVGLVAGKPLGVVIASKLATRSGIAELPPGATGRQVLGVGNAAGIGFTVALFIAELAFTDNARQAEAKLAILVASVVSALFAVAVFLTGKPGDSDSDGDGDVGDHSDLPATKLS